MQTLTSDSEILEVNQQMCTKEDSTRGTGKPLKSDVRTMNGKSAGPITKVRGRELSRSH